MFPAAAVAKTAENVMMPDEETFAAMHWASKLSDDASVLCLIRSLPKDIVEEQVQKYRERETTAVAVSETQIVVRGSWTGTRTLVAQRFHKYLVENNMNGNKRLPYGAIARFIKTHIQWKWSTKTPCATLIRRWYHEWKKTSSNLLAAEAEEKQSKRVSSEKDLLRSRSRVITSFRKRARGAGKQFTVPLVRKALYEWFSSIRYAIDWKALVAENRSRGKKHLARFSRSILRLKANEMLQG